MNTMIEMYDRIMSVVEEVTGISKDKILTSNCEECVDARHILVYILGNRSFSDKGNCRNYSRMVQRTSG